MFDISWSELLILAVVTLIFVGPKELPRFLSTIGRYTGVMRRHANEFRKVFDQAMREAELDQVKREMESVRNDLASTMRQAEVSAAATPPAPRPEPQAKTSAVETAPPPVAVEGTPAAVASEGAPSAPDTARPENAHKQEGTA